MHRNGPSRPKLSQIDHNSRKPAILAPDQLKLLPTYLVPCNKSHNPRTVTSSLILPSSRPPPAVFSTHLPASHLDNTSPIVKYNNLTKSHIAGNILAPCAPLEIACQQPGQGLDGLKTLGNPFRKPGKSWFSRRFQAKILENFFPENAPKPFSRDRFFPPKHLSSRHVFLSSRHVFLRSLLPKKLHRNNFYR